MGLPFWLRLVPRFVRRRLYARRLGFCPADIEGLTFKLADTRDEWEQAFRLGHDIGQRIGVVHARKSGLRMTSRHALPSTAVFVAKDGSRVVGTMSLIEDSPLGLPLDTVYGPQIDRLRVRRRRVAEVSALAVLPEYRGVGLTMTMTRMMWRWAYFYRQVTDLCIQVRPSVEDYYGTALLFERLGPPVRRQDPMPRTVVAMRLDLETTVERYQRAYGERKAPRLGNLYRFMVLDPDGAHTRLPKRLNHLWVDTREAPLIDGDDLRYFHRADRVLDELDLNERRYLAESRASARPAPSPARATQRSDPTPLRLALRR